MTFLAVLLVAALAFGGLAVSRALLRVWKGRVAAAQTVSFQRLRPEAALRILVAGDSTGVGVAVRDPSESVAGRLGELLPDAHVENISRNGARTRDVLAQVRTKQGQQYTLVLLQVGGNDILRFTPFEDLTRDLSTLLDEARAMSDHVVLLSAGNVGLAPLFPRAIGWVYTHRTRAVQEIFTREAKHRGVLYVDLFKERKDDIFLTDPLRYYAPDFLHLSGEGYRVWYERVVATLRSNKVQLIPAWSGEKSAQ